MEEKREKRIRMLTLAFGIALICRNTSSGTLG